MPDQPDHQDVAVLRDDRLLDALGRGHPLPDGDDLALLLAAWQADVRVEPPTGRVPAASMARTSTAARQVTAPPPSDSVRASEQREPTMRDRPPVARYGSALRRRARALAATAAAAVAAGLVLSAAATAGPDSPLWPITRVVYQDRADASIAQRAAEERISRARTAVDSGRYADADHLLDEAETLIARVREPRTVDRLRTELAAVRGLVPGSAPALPDATQRPTPDATAAVPSVTPSPDGLDRSTSGLTGTTDDDGTTGLPVPSASPVPALPLPGVTAPDLSPPDLHPPSLLD